MGSLSIWHWLIVLAIVVIIFGAKKLRNVGSDLGAAIRNFKQAMKDGDEQGDTKTEESDQAPPKKIGAQSGKIIEGDVVSRSKKKV